MVKPENPNKNSDLHSRFFGCINGFNIIAAVVMHDKSKEVIECVIKTISEQTGASPENLTEDIIKAVEFIHFINNELKNDLGQEIAKVIDMDFKGKDHE